MAKLTVHKSNIDRKRRHEVRADMRQHAQQMASTNNVRAFAIVALTDDGRALAAWDTGGVVPMWSFASTIKAVLQSDMENNLDCEDFKAPITKGAWSK